MDKRNRNRNRDSRGAAGKRVPARTRYLGNFPSLAEADRFRRAWVHSVAAAPRFHIRENADDFLRAFSDALEFPEGVTRPDRFKDATEADIDRLYGKVAHDIRYRPSALDRRVDWLADVFGFDAVERDIVAVCARHVTYAEWRTLVSVANRNSHELNALSLAALTGHRLIRIDGRLRQNSKLARSGLITLDHDGEVTPNRILRGIANCAIPAGPGLMELFTHKAGPSRLTRADFAHLGEQVELAARLVASGTGCSILLHGVPGTGKTELARLLAEECGHEGHFVGVAGERGAEPDRSDRIAQLQVVRALTAKRAGSVIIVDEADEIFTRHYSSEFSSMSKLWLNQLVESCSRPTIWIVNEPDMLGEWIVRRMDMAIAFGPTGVAVRRRIVKRAADSHGLRLDPSALERVAALPVAPAVLEATVRAAKRAGANGAQAVLIGEGLAEAIGGAPPARYTPPAVYDPALSVADTDLAALADRLCTAPSRGWSLLLSGLSGTGKSAYARFLAERMEIEVIERRGSDLLGMFVGETEANIAAAFREAARAKALLLIDEADDFLSDRREAVRSWERTLVAEMLRWMERLDAPFVATTNLADRLDPATQRRFTLRATFGALDEGRADDLFLRHFGTTPPPGTRLTGQTPGDFAQIAHRAALLGETDPATLMRWLRAEADARNGAGAPMGFGA